MPQQSADAPRKVLYSPEILAAAIGLADFPLDPSMEHRGTARSRSCGSTLDLALALDRDGRIVQVGCRAKACAVGQAGAYLFVTGAEGRDAHEVAAARDKLAAWLAGAGPPPDWRGIGLLDDARGYPGRHGAILLAWDAALAALASADELG